MKRILLILCIGLALTVKVSAGIYNNAGTGPEDSLAIVFQVLDEDGNPVPMASGDSVYFLSFYPNGTLAYRDSMAYDNAKITSQVIGASFGSNAYCLRYPVASVDGTGEDGTYQARVIVYDASLGLRTPVRVEFQVYQQSDFSTRLNVLYSLLSGVDVDTDTLLNRTLGGWADVNSLATTVGLVRDTTNSIQTRSRLLADTANVIIGYARNASGDTDSLVKAENALWTLLSGFNSDLDTLKTGLLYWGAITGHRTHYYYCSDDSASVCSIRAFKIGAYPDSCRLTIYFDFADTMPTGARFWEW